MSYPNASRPQPKAQPLLVTAALIRDGERILIAQRKLDSVFEAGKWEFPGGKVEFGEHPETCLIREIQEELGLEIVVEEFHSLVSHVYEKDTKKTHIVLLCYWCRKTGGQLQALDVLDARWVSRSEMSSFVFAAADIPIVQSLGE